MPRSDRRETRRADSPTRVTRRRVYAHMAILTFLTIGVFVAMAFFISHSQQSGAQSTAPPAAKDSVAKPDPDKRFKRLEGSWIRPDGGYVLEIREVDAIGKMTAAYFNPRPINVSVAKAALDGSTLKVFIELRDMNYPGATSHLTYDPGSDQLKGVYFQPALQQSFDIAFIRMKKERP
jgi:hypothetical protein